MRSLTMALLVTTSLITFAIADDLGTRLEKDKHPVGTKMLTQCKTTAGTASTYYGTTATLSTHSVYILDSDDNQKACYTEREITAWSDSGQYVQLRTVGEKEDIRGWFKVSEFAYIEILPRQEKMSFSIEPAPCSQLIQ